MVVSIMTSLNGEHLLDDIKRRSVMVRVLNIVICCILASNILTGITVIILITNRLDTAILIPEDRITKLTSLLNSQIKSAYLEFAIQTEKEDDEDEKPASIELISALKPVAHLSGLNFDNVYESDIRTNTSDVPSLVREWVIPSGTPRDLLWNGMVYENGSLTVPVHGIYMVYSNVKFYVSNSRKEDKPKGFHHGIVKHKAAEMKGEKIVMNEEVECKDGINDGAILEYLSSLKRLVELNAGDRLSVDVGDLDLMTEDVDWQYFGAYLI